MLHHKYETIKVIGFTDEVYKYMSQTNLMISKPEEITLFETIHSEFPLLVIELFYSKKSIMHILLMIIKSKKFQPEKVLKIVILFNI